MWQYLALLIAVIIGILILVIIWHIRNLVTDKDVYSVVPIQKCLYSKEFNKLKSGDILYMRSSITNFQEIAIPYVYKHIAIIVEFNNILYCAEATSKTILGKSGNTLISRKSGVAAYPLRDKLKNSLGPVFISKLNKPLTMEINEKLQDTTIQHLGEEYPSILYLYFIFTLGLPLKTKMYCHTFVYECLYSMGLISSKMKNRKKIGKFITAIYEHDLNNGYRYEFPKQLIYDYEENEEGF